MTKKNVVITLLFWVLCVFAYAQNAERPKIESISFYNFITERRVTFNKAVLFAKGHTYAFMSNAGSASARQQVYGRWSFFDPNTSKWSEWSSWEHDSAIPHPYKDESLLAEVCVRLLEICGRENCGSQALTEIGGKQVMTVRILATSPSSTYPVWFDKNGYMNTFFNCYIILDDLMGE
jgi:hypothetical protein